MREYTFVICKHMRDAPGELVTRTWNDWLPAFLNHTIRGTPKDASAGKPVHNKNKNHKAVILGETDGKGREDENMVKIHAMALDLDNSPEQDLINYVFPQLEPYEYVAHTTHKHGSDLAKGIPRIRIVMPLQEPYAAKHHRSYWERLNALVSGRNDPSTKNESRLNFLPSTFDKSLAESFHHKGMLLDPSKLPETQDLFAESSVLEEDALAVKGRLLKKIARIEKEDTRKEPLRALLVGRDYASPGKGHAVLLSCINYLADMKKISPEHFRAIFGPSIELHARVSKTPETIESAWRDYDRRHTAKDLARRKALLGFDKYTPYTDEQFARICKAQGVKIPEELRERWILQYNLSTWFLSETGEYVGPFPKGVRTLQMKFELSRAIDLFAPSKINMPPQLMTYTEASMKYATPLAAVRADLSLQKSRFICDPSPVLEYAINPIRTDLKPQYDPLIDEWLRVMCGSKHQKIVDWLSIYMDLNVALCAIYFAGKAGCGKSLFSQGISKLWTKGPATDLVEVLGKFNSGIDRCPVLFGDENIQISYRKVTAEIRKILGNPARKFNEKYLSPIDLKGYLRVVLAANHDKMLRDHEQKTKEDLEAIARRVLFIQPPPEATAFLEQKTIVEKVGRWGEQGIAEHALWLRENHKIEERGSRFVVEGDMSSMTTGLVMAEDMSNFVCEVIVKFLQTPEQLNQVAYGTILKKDNQVFAMVSGIQTGWKQYLDQTHLLPETQPIAQALRTLSTGKVSQRPPGGSPRKYYKINVEYLLRWAEENGDLEPEDVLQLIGVDSAGQSSDNIIPIRNETIEY